MLRRAIFALYIVASAASADPQDACSMDRAAWFEAHGEALAGTWTQTSGFGVLSMNGMTRELPPSGEQTQAAITFSDGGMTIGNVPGAGPVALEPWGGSIDYDGDGGGFRPEGAMSALDMETLVGCDPNTLPMFKATGSFTEAEGRVDFDLYVVVQSTDNMYGYTIGRLNGGQGVARRIISLTK